MTGMKRFLSVTVLVVFASMLIMGCGSTKVDKPKDAWPKNNFNGIITWGAGGVMDNISRTLAPLAEKNLGKNIILSNKPGATGAVAMQYVYDQKSDGYTLLFGAENAQLNKIFDLSKLDYDDFEPIIIAGKGISVLVTYKDSPLNTYDDLIKAMKENPGKFNMGSTGAGGLPQVTTALIMDKEKVKVNFVSYDGEGPIVTAMMGKQVDAAPLSVGTVAQYLKSGDLKALAVVSNSPLEMFPNIPVLGQIKPEYQESLKTFGPFYGVFVKKDTPAEAVKILREAFAKAYEDKKFQDFMKNNGIVPFVITNSDEAKRFLKTWQSQHCWLLQDVGAAKISPEKLGIPKPAK